LQRLRHTRRSQPSAERKAPPRGGASFVHQKTCRLTLAALLATVLTATLLTGVLRLLTGLLLPALLTTLLAALLTRVLRLLAGLLVRILVLLGHRQTPRFPAPRRETPALL
jgi:hypothetical protein